MGNSPPAMKLALSPEIAVSVGSARVRIAPACSIALTVALKKFCPELRLTVARAELLDDVALYFGNGHLEHHLLAAGDDEAVDHLGGIADQPRGEVESALGL